MATTTKGLKAEIMLRRDMFPLIAKTEAELIEDLAKAREPIDWSRHSGLPCGAADGAASTHEGLIRHLEELIEAHQGQSGHIAEDSVCFTDRRRQDD